MNFQAPPTQEHVQVSDFLVSTTELLLGNELESLNLQAAPIADIVQSGQAMQFSYPYHEAQDTMFQRYSTDNNQSFFTDVPSFNTSVVPVTVSLTSVLNVPVVQALPASQPPESSDKPITETEKICTNCNSLFPGKRGYPHQKTKKLICKTCWKYYRRVGKDRPPHLTSRNALVVECTNCKLTIDKKFYHPVTKQILCSPCAKYHKRHGRDRPPEGFPPPNKTLSCTHCKLPEIRKTRRHPKTGALLCDPCARYYKRQGVDRPSHLFSKKQRKFRC